MEFPRLSVIALALTVVSGRAGAQPITLRDGAGQTVTLKAPARRVASLIASSIDIMISLGAADWVAARTRYDTASAVKGAIDVGGGLDPSIEVLLSARPDLFIAWKGQGNSAATNRMRALGVPVYLIDTRDTAALFASVRDLGTMLGLPDRAASAASALRMELRAVQRAAPTRSRPRAVYVISQSPVIIAAAGSYMAELISVAGADNPFRDVAGEFPTLSLEAFLARDPDVLIAGRPRDGTRLIDRLRATPGWRDLRAVKRGAVIEVDSEQWGRPTLGIGALVRALASDLARVAPSATKR